MKHGHCKSPDRRSGTYMSWDTMVQRCTNPTNSNYKNYGGRGIVVYPPWLEFANFLHDMGDRPFEKTLDRYPNNKGNYCPSNCRWATRKEQQNNNRANHRLQCYDGPKGCKTISEWVDISGRHSSTIVRAIQRGYTPKQAVFGKPKRGAI